MPRYLLNFSGVEWKQFLASLYFSLTKVKGSHHEYRHPVFGTVRFNFHGTKIVDTRAQDELKTVLRISQKELHELSTDKQRHRAFQKKIQKMIEDGVSMERDTPRVTLGTKIDGGHQK